MYCQVACVYFYYYIPQFLFRAVKGNGSDPDFKFVKGYVIDREICHIDEISDYFYNSDHLK